MNLALLRRITDTLWRIEPHGAMRLHGLCGVAEEAPGAYKDVGAVVDAAQAAGLAKKVARLEPLICIKG